MVVMDLAVGGLLGANEVRRLGQESVAPSLEAACGSSWEIDNDARWPTVQLNADSRTRQTATKRFSTISV